MSDEAADIKEVKKWKSGPEVEGLNEMCDTINACVKAINALKKKGGTISFIAKSQDNTKWLRFESKGMEVEEVENVCTCVCSCYCTSGGGDVGSV